MYRTINSTKPLGGKLSQQEKEFLVENDEMNFVEIVFYERNVLFVVEVFHFKFEFRVVSFELLHY